MSSSARGSEASRWTAIRDRTGELQASRCETTEADPHRPSDADGAQLRDKRRVRGRRTDTRGGKLAEELADEKRDPSRGLLAGHEEAGIGCLTKRELDELRDRSVA